MSSLLIGSVVSGLPHGAHVAATAHPSSSAPRSAPEASLYAGHWVSFACLFTLMTFFLNQTVRYFTKIHSFLLFISGYFLSKIGIELVRCEFPCVCQFYQKSLKLS